MRELWSVVGWSLHERKWSVDKCSEVEWSVVGWSVVRWSEVLRNRMSNIIRRYEYIDNMNYGAYMVFSFITLLHVLLVPLFIIVYMVVRFCLIL